MRKSAGTRSSAVAIAGVCLALLATPAFGQVPQFPNAVYALAVHPVNTSIVYAATDHGLLKTTDGGASWQPSNSGLPSARVTAVAIDPVNPSTVYVGTEGVYKSTNGGSTWVRASTGIPSTSLGVAVIAIDPTNPSILYAGLFAAAGFGLVRSTDAGATWITATSPVLPKTTFDGLALDPANTSVVYAASMNGGVFKSTDKGVTWANASSGLSGIRVTALVIDRNTPSTLYARVRGFGMFKTTNGGASWASANSGLSASADLVGYASALLIDPANSSILYTGTYSGGVFKSTNAGASWAAANSGFPPNSGGALAIDPQNSSILYAGTTDGRIYKSTNAGASWTIPDNSGPCVQSVSPGAQAFTPSGGSAAIAVTAAGGCAWNATSNASWVTFTGSSSGTGSGSIAIQVAENTGAGRTGTVTVGGIPLNVEQQAGSIVGLNYVGALAHLAAQGIWNTTFTLVNKSAGATTARLSLFGDAGDALRLPLLLPQTSTTPIVASSLDRTLAGNSSLIVNTAEVPASPFQVGAAQLAGTGALDGFAIFHLIPGSQEAVVPLETRNAGSYVLAFDNTGGVVLGVAIQNISAQAATIPVTIRDDAGVPISPPGTTLSLPANGHTSFVLSQQYSFTENKFGTIEFTTPAGGRISVLGIRTTPLATPSGTTLTLTTVPALANVGTNGGSIAHIATGNGWQTTFVLVNTGAQLASATLKFFATGTGAPLSIPLSFPQAGGGASAVANSVTRNLAAGASLVVQSAAPASDPIPTTGSAQLTTDGNVGGFVVFRYNTNGQEAVVPLETRTAAGGFVIAFDNTAGTLTGIAINSVSSQTLNVPVTIRDDAGSQMETDTLSMPANSHRSFTLGADRYPVTAGKRGTIEFAVPAGGNIGVLGIRIPPKLTFTTLPALAK